MASLSAMSRLGQNEVADVFQPAARAHGLTSARFGPRAAGLGHVFCQNDAGEGACFNQLQVAALHATAAGLRPCGGAASAAHAVQPSAPVAGAGLPQQLPPGAVQRPAGGLRGAGIVRPTAGLAVQPPAPVSAAGRGSQGSGAGCVFRPTGRTLRPVGGAAPGRARRLAERRPVPAAGIQGAPLRRPLPLLSRSAVPLSPALMPPLLLCSVRPAAACIAPNAWPCHAPRRCCMSRTLISAPAACC